MAPFFLFKRNSPFACPLAAQLPAVKVIRPLPALGGPHGRRPWWGRNVWGDSSTAEDLPRRGGLSAPGGRRSHGRGVRPGGKVTRRGRGEALGGRDRGQPLRGAATPRQRGRGAGAEGTWRAGQTAEPGRGIPGVRGGSRGGVCVGVPSPGQPPRRRRPYLRSGTLRARHFRPTPPTAVARCACAFAWQRCGEVGRCNGAWL